MSRIFFVLLFIVITTGAKAQINELGVFAGGTNYIGDVGPTTYIAPNNAAFGLLYKWNRSPRHSYRASFTYGKITSSDGDSDVSGRKQRGYEFENSIKELSLGLEFSFFDFDLHEADVKITPYVYSGLSYFWYDELYVQNSITFREESTGGIAIPMVVGIKTNIIPNFVLGVEVGARYTFTDNIDGSSPENESLGFGNLESNDWYVFTGVTLTYTFGEKPCFCLD